MVDNLVTVSMRASLGAQGKIPGGWRSPWRCRCSSKDSDSEWQLSICGYSFSGHEHHDLGGKVFLGLWGLGEVPGRHIKPLATDWSWCFTKNKENRRAVGYVFGSLHHGRVKWAQRDLQGTEGPCMLAHHWGIWTFLKTMDGSQLPPEGHCLCWKLGCCSWGCWTSNELLFYEVKSCIVFLPTHSSQRWIVLSSSSTIPNASPYRITLWTFLSESARRPMILIWR